MQDVARLYAPGMEVEATRHISLFALAPIPLLVFLGFCLSNKVAVEFYQRHRTGTEPWKWKTDGAPARYTLRKRCDGSDSAAVALVLSLSGTVANQLLPSGIDDRFTVYDITLVVPFRTRNFCANGTIWNGSGLRTVASSRN